MAEVKKRWRDQPRLGIMDVTSNDTLFRASLANQEPAEGRQACRKVKEEQR